MGRTVRALVAIGVVAASVFTAVPAGAARGPKTWVVLPSQSVQARSRRRMLATHPARAGCVHAVRDDHEGRHLAPRCWLVLAAAPSSSLRQSCPRTRARSSRAAPGSASSGRPTIKGEVTKRVADVTVSGIMFAGWPSMGVFAFGTTDLRLIGQRGLRCGRVRARQVRFDRRRRQGQHGGRWRRGRHLPRRFRERRGEGHAQRGVRCAVRHLHPTLERHHLAAEPPRSTTARGSWSWTTAGGRREQHRAQVQLRHVQQRERARRRTKLRHCRVAASCCWGPRTRWSRGTRSAGTPAPRSTRAASC